MRAGLDAALALLDAARLRRFLVLPPAVECQEPQNRGTGVPVRVRSPGLDVHKGTGADAAMLRTQFQLHLALQAGVGYLPSPC